MQTPPSTQTLEEILAELFGGRPPIDPRTVNPDPVTKPAVRKGFPAFGAAFATLVLVTAAVGAGLWLTRPKIAAPIPGTKPVAAPSPLEPSRPAPPKPAPGLPADLPARQKRWEAQAKQLLRADDWRRNRQMRARLRRALTSLKQISKRLGDRASVELCDTALARLRPYGS